MVKDGYLFLIPVLLLLIGALALGLVWVVLALGGMAAFLAFFFRDPERTVPGDPGVIVSPADGRVVGLQKEQDGYRLSIFLSILDVHVIRAPMAGTLTRQSYQPGRFRVAYDHRASVENERVDLTLSGSRRELTFALIAGIVARRIRVWAGEGATFGRGDRMGLIRFGSRVDVRLPEGCEPRVRKGERVRGGSSVLARWREDA